MYVYVQKILKIDCLCRRGKLGHLTKDLFADKVIILISFVSKDIMGCSEGKLIGSLSTRVFETRTATGSELFSLLTCLHTTTFTLLSIFSLLEMISIKIWETPLSWHAKCSLPVAVRVSKTCVLKLPNMYLPPWASHNSYLKQ